MNKGVDKMEKIYRQTTRNIYRYTWIIATNNCNIRRY